MYKTYKAYLMGVPWKTKEKKIVQRRQAKKNTFKILAQADLIRGR
jgi:hypothetical protein